MHHGKAMLFAILMADAFGCPTADGIDDVGWTFYGKGYELPVLAKWMKMMEV